MREHDAPDETQPTKPKKGKPVEIPVPKVSTIRAALRRVSKPEGPEDPERDE